MLSERRIKEVNLKSYISLKIDDVLATTDSDEQVTSPPYFLPVTFSNTAYTFQSRSKGESHLKSVIGEGGSVATKNSIGSSINGNHVFFTDSDSLTQSSFAAKGQQFHLST